MTPKDFIVTPLLVILILVLSWIVRGKVTDRGTSKYFYPALLVKMSGAIALGLIYQFYYNGGDTFNYFRSGSYYIWQAFLDSPMKGLSLIFTETGKYTAETYEYASRIIFFDDRSSFFVIRIAGICDLFTFHTYSATAILFSIFSFSGLWAMYSSFCRLYPRMRFELAVSVFFIPSVFFWGSGLLKDSLTIGLLGWAIFAFIGLFIDKRISIRDIIILLVSLYFLFVIKIYILLCFAPSLLIWLSLEYISVIKNLVLRVMLLPFILALLILSGYLAVQNISSDNPKYNIPKLSETAEATARWISFVSESEGGSSYTLGDYDFSPAGLISKSYKAVWVTLFRPYLWESNNPVMLLSAIESLALLLLTVYVLIRSGFIRFFTTVVNHPVILFSLVFALSFSFAVGISTYNFGTLVRYKIPMMPFYVMAMFLIIHYSKRRRKFLRLEAKE
jgi:hypothetical protein